MASASRLNATSKAAVVDSNPATIVIINDDATERARLTMIAERAGHQVVSVTGAEALKLLAPPLRTILVIDSEIRDISPYQLIDALHERGVYLPTLVTVPPNAVIDAVSAIQRDAADVLEHPLQPSRFLYSIDAVLRRRPKPSLPK
jgi:DNA-binding NtrC family response regulator